MKFFWSGVVFLALYFFCELVASDYSESMMPSKEMRNRVHRTMRVNMRVGKRYGDSEYDEEAPKRKLRMIMRTGKRTQNTPPQPYTVKDLLADFKRSSPQFLLNPRVGKNDQQWKIRAMENLSKRSDPKATDLWFGPRIGRANEELVEDFPWNYVVLNGNRLSNSNEPEEQQNEETTE
ncbi:unnamed protein product [Ceutorhynchus assimilis]|uniref:Uncharacterized protein n=1 Tax=Ceutorhynchus assimilis TaxID=467358 RepID=A0A9P0GQE7_9CUCU|nr:unnamed protein product [Ceutorhynchus assimilis]